MEKHQVVPDIIDRAPKATLEVSSNTYFAKIYIAKIYRF